MKITSKAQMYQLYEAGAFGNKPQTWRTLDDFYADTTSKQIVLRYKGQSGGGWCEYDLNPSLIPGVVAKWVSEGAEPSRITVSEFIPDDRLIIQGEVMRSTAYLDLRYSTLKVPMRKALATEQYHVSGVRAVALLRQSMDPDSFDLLTDLLNTYEDAAIEFSTWGCDIGTILGRNTIFWEVRNY